MLYPIELLGQFDLLYHEGIGQKSKLYKISCSKNSLAYYDDEALKSVVELTHDLKMEAKCFIHIPMKRRLGGSK